MQSLTEKPLKKLTLVFNIDRTLALHQDIEDEERLFLLRNGMLIFADYQEYQIIPGVIELLQYVFTKDYVNLAFFSTGYPERDKILVNGLLTRVVGDAHYLKIKSSIKILSRDDLTDANQCPASMISYGISGFEPRKNLTKAFSPGSSLENTILIEHNPSCLYPGQERSLLRSLDSDVLYSLLKKETKEGIYQAFKDQNNFYKFNSIFYLAGVLSRCFQDFEQNKKPTDRLANMHYEYTSHAFFAARTRFLKDIISQYDAFFKEGLDCLQTLKPSLRFIDRNYYLASIKKPATDSEQEELNKCNSLIKNANRI